MDEQLPRTPLVFDEKTKWRLEDDGKEGALAAKNYCSIWHNWEEIRGMFKEEVEEGWLRGPYALAEAKRKNAFLAQGGPDATAHLKCFCALRARLPSAPCYYYTHNPPPPLYIVMRPGGARAAAPRDLAALRMTQDGYGVVVTPRVEITQ